MFDEGAWLGASVRPGFELGLAASESVNHREGEAGLRVGVCRQAG